MGVDDSQGITVWQPSGSDDGIADVFSINVVGKQMVVMAGIGSRGCNAPDSPVKGCYRLAVARTNFPMGFHLANEDRLSGAVLPGNAMEYAKFMFRPDGSKLLYAHFLSGRSDPGYPIQSGCGGIVLKKTDDPTFWNNPCPGGKAFPDWGPRDRMCLPSCGGLHGTISFNTPCGQHGKRDVGKAWDVPYCCAGNLGRAKVAY